MDLVVKPTERCNFKCTFCSSTSIADNPTDELPLEQIYTFLERFPDTETIIVNGGDPLMMPTTYYDVLLAYLEVHHPKVVVSITSNLWPFFKKPEKWKAIFQHPQFNVMTSFQFGDKRLKGDLTPYTVDEFWQVSNKVLEVCGYRPDFIAVIDEDNADTVIPTVELAKAMNVDCKVNYAMASGPVVQYKTVQMGNEGHLYLLADMYERYLEIYRAGLAPWEYNTRQMMKKIRGELTSCPLSRTCDEGIRTLQPSGRYYSCPAMADDDLYRINFDEEMTGPLQRPLEQDPELLSMKNSCFGCPMFGICNGCRKTMRDHKRLGLVEKHCRKMKTLAPEIIEANGLTGQLTPTPYVNETEIIAVG